MVARSALSAAPPPVAWELIARPRHWARWAPHVRGAWGLTGPDGVVRAGARGAARLVGVVPVPVVVTAVEPGRSWTWRVAGTVTMDHVVAAAPDGGSVITVTLAAPRALEVALARSYAPLIGLLVRRLAHVAAAEAALPTAGADQPACSASSAAASSSRESP